MARQREFDEAVVLDRAMTLFWRHGYEGASMAALTRAMGLTSPSIYAAFGSKRGLFDAVMERYRLKRAGFRDWVTAAPTAYDMTERLLTGSAQWLADPAEPPGCLSVQGGVSAGPAGLDVPQRLAEIRGGVERMLLARFEAARADGELPADTDAAALARYFHAVFLGMSLQAASGASSDELRTVAGQALLRWPHSA